MSWFAQSKLWQGHKITHFNWLQRYGHKFSSINCMWFYPFMHLFCIWIVLRGGLYCTKSSDREQKMPSLIQLTCSHARKIFHPFCIEVKFRVCVEVFLIAWTAKQLYGTHNAARSRFTSFFSTESYPLQFFFIQEISDVPIFTGCCQ
jgi:hypothetical protein